MYEVVDDPPYITFMGMSVKIEVIQPSTQVLCYFELVHTDVESNTATIIQESRG